MTTLARTPAPAASPALDRPLQLPPARLLIWLLLAVNLATAVVRMVGQFMGAEVLPLPLKLADPALVLIVVGLHLAVIVLFRRWRQPAALLLLVAALGAVIFVGLLSILYWSVPPYYGLQSLYYVLRPLVVLLAALAVGWRWQDARRLLKFMFGYAMLNALVVLGQKAYFDSVYDYYSADLLRGLFNDAHIQATFSYVILLLHIGWRGHYRGLLKQAAWLGVAGLLLAAAYVSHGQKATAIFAAAAALAVGWRLLRWRPAALVLLAALPALLGLTLLATQFSDLANASRNAGTVLTGNLRDRIESVYSGDSNWVQDIGIIAMFSYYAERADSDPSAIVLGLGPSNFGSSAALAKVAAGLGPDWLQSFHALETRFHLAEGGLKLLGLSHKTSILGIAVGELGVFAAVLVIALLAWPLLWRLPAHAAPTDKTLFFWIRIAYGFILLVSFVSALGSWDNDTAMTVLVTSLAAAYARPAAARARRPAG